MSYYCVSFTNQMIDFFYCEGSQICAFLQVPPTRLLSRISHPSLFVRSMTFMADPSLSQWAVRCFCDIFFFFFCGWIPWLFVRNLLHTGWRKGHLFLSLWVSMSWDVYYSNKKLKIPQKIQTSFAVNVGCYSITPVCWDVM